MGKKVGWIRAWGRRKLRRRKQSLLRQLKLFTIMLLGLFVFRFRVYLSNKQVNLSHTLSIAVAAEIYPRQNQGGNIRLSRVLHGLEQLGNQVTLYVRETEAPPLLKLGRHKIPVISDSLSLTHLSSELRAYDMVVSSFWFWRTEQSPEVMPIPIIVSEFTTKGVFEIPHVVLSDDLQYVRCFKTAETPRGEQTCKEIFRLEMHVWENPQLTKLFISKEDMYHAGNISKMPASSAAVLSYFWQSPRKLVPPPSYLGRYFRWQNQCTLAYFGSAHPANVKALFRLFESAGETMLEFHLGSRKKACTLLIAGDNRWQEVLGSSNLENLEDFGISLKILGFVKDIERVAHSATLVILPVVVGGTGVSTKVLQCIELGVPFISTFAGNRGFICDAECEALFFRDSLPEMLASALMIASNPELIKQMTKKLQSIMAVNIDSDPLIGTLLRGQYISTSKSQDAIEVLPATFSHKPCLAQDICEKIFEVSKSHQRKPEVSVYASIKGTESENMFFEGYLFDVLRQDMKRAWEVVLATNSVSFVELVRDSLLRVKDSMPETLTFRVVHLKSDIGLYETWDYLIASHTQGKFLQNWNIDDRKHRSAIQIKYNLLSRLPDTILVSSAVLVSETDDTWADVRMSGAGEQWFTEKSGYYALHTMFKKSHTGKLVSLNLPHNSPMYRRSVHKKYGQFSATWQKAPLRSDISPTCSDFRYWTLPLQDGEFFYHTNSPLEVYHIRKDSHNRLPENQVERCTDQAISNVFPDPKGVTHKLGFAAMTVDRIFLSISSPLDLTGGAESLSAAGSQISRRGIVLHVLVTPDMLDLSRRIFPGNVLISSYQLLENPAAFKLGIFLSSTPTTLLPKQLRKEGYFLPHRQTYHVRDAKEILSLIDTMF